MAALNPYGSAPPVPLARLLVALALASASAAIPAVGWAKDIPDRTDQTERSPAQNPPPEAQPKAPAPVETKTGVIRPPDVDAKMSKPVPNVDPKMAKPPLPQAPTVPEKRGQEPAPDKSSPDAQPR